MKRWSVALVCLIIGALAGGFLLRPLLSGQRAGAKETVAKNDQPAGTPMHPVITHIPRELTSYRDIVKQVLPAVVSIQTQPKPRARTSRSPRNRSGLDNPRIPDELRKFFKGMDNFEFQMPDETPSVSFGSGFIIDPKGVIMTNYHVVAGADQVEVTLRDGSKFVSRDIKGDPKTDIAIVRIDPKGKVLHYLELGDSEAMQIGDRVLAIGAPFGLTGTVTSGIVSAKGRNGLHMNMYEDFLQTDAAINPGNSGGPLVNLEGKVIGINAAIKTRSGGFQGVGLAVASNLARNVKDQLLKYGKVHRGYLGVQIKDLTPEVARQLNLGSDHGVVVARVFPNSPAAKAGIKAGDILTQVNGKAVKDGRVLQTLVAGLPVHKSVPFTVVHDGRTETRQVLIQEQPDRFGTEEGQTEEQAPKGEPETVTLDKYGIDVGDLTPQMAKTLGFPKGTKGAVITDVDPASPAYAAGLRKGTLVTRVNRKSVASAAALKDALSKASPTKGVLLQVQTAQNGTDYVVLKPMKAASGK